jgi:hypothetical protein
VRAKPALIAVVATLAALAPSSAAASNPVASGAASPVTVAAGRSTLLTVTVAPGAGPVSTGVFVSCNLSSIGGAFNELLADDGSAGDITAGDLVFSYRATVPLAAAPGPRSLPCVASDAQGRSALAQITLVVDAAPNQPPSVSSGGPYNVDEGSSVTVTATGSDPEGGALSFAWDVDGDGLFERPGAALAFAAGDGPSSHILHARATDDGLLVADAATTVVVANVPPTATFHAPGSAEAGGRFALSLGSPQDPSEADAAAGFNYAFDCGGGYGNYSSSATATCSGADAGARSVGGRIRDKDGGVSEYRAGVDVRVTFEGLCTLTRTLSRKAKVANELCRKLTKAARARRASGRRRQLRAYCQAVRAQTGPEGRKAFGAADGALLQRLARTLASS